MMPITPQEALQRCIEHRELFHDEMTHLMRMMMNGEMSPTLVAGLLVALRTKKETVGEIVPILSIFLLQRCSLQLRLVQKLLSTAIVV